LPGCASIFYKGFGVRLVSDAPEEFNAFFSFQFLKSSVLNDELLLLLCKFARFQESHILSLVSLFANGLVENRGSAVIVALH
jgi:hypothetical protein